MLTIFSLPKAFRGHIGVIQRNAIGSWLQLQPMCQVVLLGTEDGVTDAVRDYGLQHIPEVGRNQHGTPLLSQTFREASRGARDDYLCYLNCDIVLPRQITAAIQQLQSWRQQFVAVGECWNLDVTEPINFNDARWQNKLWREVAANPTPRGWGFADYFVFPKNLYQNAPPFALGRAVFDNWLIYHARCTNVPVVDLTPALMAIHQNHDYGHVPLGRRTTYLGEEAIENRRLAGRGWNYTLLDATHCVCPSGIRRRALHIFRARYQWQRLHDASCGLFWKFVALSRPARHKLGLRKSAAPIAAADPLPAQPQQRQSRDQSAKTKRLR